MSGDDDAIALLGGSAHRQHGSRRRLKPTVVAAVALCPLVMCAVAVRATAGSRRKPHGQVRGAALEAGLAGKSQVPAEEDHCPLPEELDVNSSVSAVAADFGRMLALSGDWGNELTFWNLTSKTAIQTLKGHTKKVNALVADFDKMLALSAGQDGQVMLWNLTAQEHKDKHLLWTLHNETLHTRTLKPGDVGMRADWDTGEVETVFPESHAKKVGIKKGWYWVKINGKPYCNLCSDRAIRGKEPYNVTFANYTGAHTDVAWSVEADFQQMVALSGSADGTLKLWNLRDRFLIRTIGNSINERPASTFNAMSADFHRMLVLTGDNDIEGGPLKLFNLSIGSQLKAFGQSTDRAHAVKADFQRMLAVSGGHDQILRLWNISSGKVLQAMRGHQKEITSVAADFQTMIAMSGSEDKDFDSSDTLIVWDLRTGQQIAQLRGYSAGISDIVVDFQRNKALTASLGTVLQLYSSLCLHESPAAIETLRQRAADALRKDEKDLPPFRLA